MAKDNKREQDQQQGSNKGEKNLLEWTVFGIGLLCVLAIVGYLGYKTLAHKTSPPEIEVTFEPNPSEMAPFRYAVELSNKGGETAEEVSIELVQQKGDSTIETAALKFAFVPHGSKREGWLIFSQDPQMADTVFVRVLSYKKP